MKAPFQMIGERIDASLRDIWIDEYERLDTFNEAFDSENSAVAIAGTNTPASKALFLLRPDSYYDAYRDWLFSEGSPLALAREALDFAPSNHENFSDLFELLEKRRVAPFVGAGLSQACGMQGWIGSLQELASRSGSIDAAKVEKHIKDAEYEEAAQYVWDNLGERQFSDFIRTQFKHRDDSKITGAMAMLPSLRSHCVITTNFDNIIERVYERAKVGFAKGVIMGKIDYGFMARFLSGNPSLLKLHGNFEDPATHIFTLDQYGDAYGTKKIDFKKSLPRVPRQIYVSHSLLFVGCSLTTDRTLKLFRTVLDSKNFDVPAHYAIVEAPTDDSERKARTKHLADYGIRPIWFPNGKWGLAANLIEYLVAGLEERVAIK